MIGQVAGVLIVWKDDGEGEGVIALPRCSIHGSCIWTVVVSIERIKISVRMSEEEEGMRMKLGWEGPVNSTWHEPPVSHIDQRTVIR